MNKIYEIIKIHERRILKLDGIIDESSKKILELRKKQTKTKNYSKELEVFAEEKRIAEAKKQNYLTFIEDLESLR
jgi:hypothetical protein